MATVNKLRTQDSENNKSMSETDPNQALIMQSEFNVQLVSENIK